MEYNGAQRYEQFLTSYRSVDCIGLWSCNVLSGTLNPTIPYILRQRVFLPRDAMQARPMSSCGVCPSVCLSRSYILSKRINIPSKLFHRRVATPFFFSATNGIAIFRRESPNEGVECRWGKQKSRFWANIWLHCVLLTLLPARCQYDAVGPPSRKLWHFASSKRRCLLMAGTDGEMFMTRSFNFTPKTTRQQNNISLHAVINL